MADFPSISCSRQIAWPRFPSFGLRGRLPPTPSAFRRRSADATGEVRPTELALPRPLVTFHKKVKAGRATSSVFPGVPGNLCQESNLAGPPKFGGSEGNRTLISAVRVRRSPVELRSQRERGRPGRFPCIGSRMTHPRARKITLGQENRPGLRFSPFILGKPADHPDSRDDWLVETVGIEPTTRRCHRRVIPVHHAPQKPSCFQLHHAAIPDRSRAYLRSGNRTRASGKIGAASR